MNIKTAILISMLAGLPAAPVEPVGAKVTERVKASGIFGKPVPTRRQIPIPLFGEAMNG